VIDQQMNLGQFVAAEVLIVLILGAFEKIIQLLDTLYDVFTSLEKIEQVRDIQMLNEEVNLKEDFDSSNFYPIELTAGNDSNRVILSLLKRDRVHVISTSDTETIQQLKSIIDPTISSKYIPRWNHEVPSNEKTKLAFCKIGWFSKQTHLFEGTIKENILMGRTQINNDELNEILNLLNIKDAIASQSEGINTIMSRGSFIFNDAQKEKILIARALIGNPEVLILSFLGSCMNNEEISQLIVNIDNYLIDSTIIASGNFNTPINWQTKQL
jgi:ABC-type bacteriocin/lantibiotic exporter with double-glycine peptidase domain